MSHYVSHPTPRLSSVNTSEMAEAAVFSAETFDVVVDALDQDGAVFNAQYHEAVRAAGEEPANIMPYNRHLLDFLAAPMQSMVSAREDLIAEEGLAERVLMNFSNRQDEETDFNNRTRERQKTISGPAALKMIQTNLEHSRAVKYLKIDKLMLADLYGHIDTEALPIGTTFDRISASECAGETAVDSESPRWAFDDKKISLVYSQVHHIANQYDPSKKILFRFYDDRSDILTAINQFFGANRDLLPSNIKIELYQYDGTAAPALSFQVTGQGSIDRGYRDTLLKMAHLCDSPRQLDGSWYPIFAGAVDVALLRTFIRENNGRLSAAVVSPFRAAVAAHERVELAALTGFHH